METGFSFLTLKLLKQNFTLLKGYRIPVFVPRNIEALKINIAQYLLVIRYFERESQLQNILSFSENSFKQLHSNKKWTILHKTLFNRVSRHGKDILN